MLGYIREILSEHNITLCGSLPLSSCRVIRPYLLEKHGIGPGGRVFVFAVPYLAPTGAKPNISAYAVPEDYHRFFTGLFDDILPRLREKFPGHRFTGFTDHSPIDERAAAAAAGLGCVGRHGLLITGPYSSYVFLGEIIADPDTAVGEDAVIPDVRNSALCENCNLCAAACPYGLSGGCLSAVTQKKGELSEDERNMIAKYGFAWGCDIWQEVCPHTGAARSRGSIYTSIPYFLRALTPRLTRELVLSMSDEEFSKRAYSWRGRETILRNLELIEKSKPGTAGGTEKV